VHRTSVTTTCCDADTRRGISGDCLSRQVAATDETTFYTRYAKEVRAAQHRPAKTILLVHIDADTGTVSNRDPDVVFHWIRRRNIETWLFWLLQRDDRNEDDDYKQAFSHRFGTDRKPVKAAADQFFSLSRPNAPIPPNCPPSLRSALEESPH
jgi:hypothetical protein